MKDTIPYQELPLSQEDYDRCEKAEQAYRSLLLKADARSLRRNIEKIPHFLAVYGQGEKDIQSGLFCCQANADIPEGNRKMHLLAGFFGCIEFAGDGRGNDLSGQGKRCR